MDLSIIIVNWNTKDYLEQCLRSVFEHTKGIEYEVFVIDNASTDGSPQMVKDKFPQVKLIENQENVGFAKANNQGVRQAKGKYICLLNPDTLLKEDVFNKLILFMNNHLNAGVVGPKLLNPDGSLQPSWAKFPTVWSEIFGLRRVPSTKKVLRTKVDDFYEVDFVGGACLMIRKKVIDKVGLLDEDFFMFTEEVDWCYRTKSNGWKIYFLPKPSLVHYQGKSSKQVNFWTKKQLQSSKLLFFEKYNKKISYLALKIYFSLLNLMKP